MLRRYEVRTSATVIAIMGIMAASVLFADMTYINNGGRARSYAELRTCTNSGSEKTDVSHNGVSVYKTGDTKIIMLPGGANIVMIYCAPGSFCDGGAFVQMDHGFWLGKYEVTQKQWKSVMNGTDVENPSKWKDDNLPVEAVSWDDCQRFIGRVNEKLKCDAHLPEESEWEYACRAGMNTAHLNGLLDVMAWHGRNSGHMTHVVGQKQANQWGFHDMLGNVWEWSNTRGIMRGGGWLRSPNSCHPGTRRYNDPGKANNDHGFRLCISTLPQSQIAFSSHSGNNDWVKPQNRCWMCYGKGTVLRTVRETCDNCNGRKVITTKVTLNDRYDWWYGGSVRKESMSTRGCPKCNRTGSISVKRDVECPQCHGTGKR